MPTHAGPNTFGEENLIFGYDLADTVNSYIGQPTTNNFGGNFRDFTGTGYSPDGEWISSEPTRLTKTYFANLPTPIGPGGTLIEESGTAGFHHLSRYGGGDESGAHSLSCYIRPLTTGITDFCIGMLADGSNNIQFNLDTRVITYGGGISNRNAFIKDVPGWPGWLRVGANIEGRVGGWVGCFGYSSYTSYTGTAGGKKAYITGIQYEYTAHPTPFVGGTRSATQGLLDLASNSTINLSSVSFNSNAQMTFDGTDDTVPIGIVGGYSSNITCEAVFRTTSGASWKNMISGGCGDIIFTVNGNLLNFGAQCSSPIPHANYSNTVVNTGAWFHAVATYDGSRVKIYINGVLENTYARSGSFTPSSLRVGSANGGVSEFFQGDLPLLKFYNRALTESEVARNFNAIKSRFNI